MARQHMQIVSISTYKFVTLDDRGTLCPTLLTECQMRELKSTVLLAPEGINIFLTGSREITDSIVGWLRAGARFTDLAPKESLSDHQPFRRLLVRMKKKIVTMRHPLIRPEDGRAPSVMPPGLKRWLGQGHDDESRPVVMLDMRNDYEVAIGTFKNVVKYNLRKSTEFPPTIATYENDLAGKTVVSFCVGGIRCEKTTIHIQEIGVERAYQLEDGILKYFEEVGDTHYDGDCFVFDHRTALNAELQPVGPKRCFVCRAAVTSEEQQSVKYIPGQRCPRCADNQTRTVA